jgi:imidazolonepropionase-like amidohydrolase
VLAPGKLADVVVWDGMPAEDINALRRTPRAVFLGGERVV